MNRHLQTDLLPRPREAGGAQFQGDLTGTDDKIQNEGRQSCFPRRHTHIFNALPVPSFCLVVPRPLILPHPFQAAIRANLLHQK
jgi:hypothetical protein